MVIGKTRELINHNRGEQYLPKYRVYLYNEGNKGDLVVQAQSKEDAKKQAKYFAEDGALPVYAEEYTEGERTSWSEILDEAQI